MNDRGCGIVRARKIGETLLVGIALAMGLTFATQAFALPYCPKYGHYVCADFEE